MKQVTRDVKRKSFHLKRTGRSSLQNRFFQTAETEFPSGDMPLRDRPIPLPKQQPTSGNLNFGDVSGESKQDKNRPGNK